MNGWKTIKPEDIGRSISVDGKEVEVIHRGVVTGTAYSEEAQYFLFEDRTGAHSYRNATEIRYREKPGLEWPGGGKFVRVVVRRADGTEMEMDGMTTANSHVSKVVYLSGLADGSDYAYPKDQHKSWSGLPMWTKIVEVYEV